MTACQPLHPVRPKPLRRRDLAVAGVGTLVAISRESDTAARRKRPPRWENGEVFDKIGNNYRFVRGWGETGAQRGQFRQPHGIAYVAGSVYVVDRNNHRIQRFSGEGGFIGGWGSLGPGVGQFSAPYGVAVDAGGNVYVTDTGNQRVQKFDPTGTPLATIGSQGSGPGQYDTPQGIAVDRRGNVFVVDSRNERIVKFDGAGNGVAAWGRHGRGKGAFDSPTGIAVDNSGNVFVADTGNNRIQKFDNNGKYLTRWGEGGEAVGRFDSPIGLAVEATSTSVVIVYVADSSGNRIQKFAFHPGGDNTMTAFGSEGTANGKLRGPLGVAVDSQRRVFVTDSQNDRVQVFRP